MIAALRFAMYAVPAAVPSTVQAQQLGGGGDGPAISIVRVAAALAICLAAAFALALVVRRRGESMPRLRGGWLKRAVGASRRIEVIEARRLSSFADVCLVRCDGAEYLLLCGASGQAVLHSSSPVVGGNAA